MSRDRGAIDTALPNMFSNRVYSSTYLFYAHMVGQCSIVIDKTLPAAAGVAFIIDHYKLYINPDKFDKYPLVVQLGILKHEMEHILNNHVQRKEDRAHLPWNYATDCAINQLIQKDHLPTITQEDLDNYDAMAKIGMVDASKPRPKLGSTAAIYPETFPVPVKANWTSEQYYDALKNKEEQEQEEQECSKCGGSGRMDEKDKGSDKEDQDESEEGPNSQEGDGKCTCDRCHGDGKEPGQGSYGEGNGKLVDDHGTWDMSSGDVELQKDMTKQMIDRSINETLKAKGNLPHNIEHYIDMFTRKSQVSWKRVLRNIVGNKKVNTRRTVMKRDRRFPGREDLRGKTKDRMFDLTILVDVSGSMSDDEIMTGLNEIHHICKLTKTTMKLIQIDTVVHKEEEFSSKTKIFQRNGMGGTIMEAGIEYIRDNKIPTDACILITDGYIEDVSRWRNPPKYKMMFLVTTKGHKIPGIQHVPRYQQFDLTIEKAT